MLLEEKTNFTILFSLLFVLGIISFFVQLQIPILFCVAVFVIFLVSKRVVNVKVAIILLISFLCGFYLSGYRVNESDALSKLAPQKYTTIEGQIVSIPETNKPQRTKFYLKADKIKTKKFEKSGLNSKVIVTLNEPREIYSKIKIGDRLSLNGKLNLPQKAENPAEFSYANYLRFENTFTTFYVDKDNFTLLSKPSEFQWKFLQKIGNQRDIIIQKHSKVLKSPYLELLGGVVFGDDAINPTDDLKEAFKISGLLHLLAASGLNVGLIFTIWFFIASRLKMNYRLNVITGSILIIIYTCMTGFSPSILRATIMLEFVLLGKLIDRQADNFALICFVCFLMLLYNPAWICSISFQLSFLVTSGLILSMPLFNDFVEKKLNKVWLYVANSCVVPLVAQIWVLPIQMFYFNTFSSYSIFANILVLPFITVVSFVGFVSSIVALIPFVPDVIINFCDKLLSPFLIITVKISEFISHLPNANIITIQPNIFQVIAYYVLLLCLGKFFKDKMKNKKLLIVAAVIFGLLIGSFIQLPDNKLHLTFFSVKNADSCLIKTPKNHYFVIDTGKQGFNSNYSQGDAIIAKYLLSKGIKKIDFVVLSHLDNDHIGGTVGLLDKIRVDKVYVNTDIPSSETSQKLFDYMKKRNIPYVVAKNDMEVLKEEGLIFNIYMNKSIDENGKSIINYLKYKDFVAVFMGDAGVRGFRVLPQNIKIDVLKLGHHGAKGTINKEVLNKFEPKTVIISTGKNPYKHPHKMVTDLLYKNHTHYLRTDKKNAIEIVTDGINTKENCFSPQKHKFIECSIK